MTDFKIFRAKSSELFPHGELNSRLIIEEGCWYLCTDTAELFLGVLEEDEYVLKQINHPDVANRPSFAPDHDDEDGGTSSRIIGAYIDETSGELFIIFSDGTEESLGKVVGDAGKDGLVTSIKIGDTVYEHADGLIELTDIATVDYIESRIAALEEDSDVLTYGYRSGFPITGESGKLYVAVDEEKTYIWFDGRYLAVGGSSGSYEEPEIIYGGSAN